MTESTTATFLESLWEYYAHHGRTDLPWRQPAADGSFDPYHILVSEIMLQQTQVQRVLPKYQEFLATFPTTAALAAAPLSQVLVLWSGLGYNRRAKFLHQAAQQIITAYKGVFPDSMESLVKLPGVGKNTAGAVLAYAFNQPVVFVETNIRTVYIHHFFADQDSVPDAVIIERLTTTLDNEQPREFYWALMDYGSHLKQTVGNLSRASKSYHKQAAFKGSVRQLRGQVLRVLGAAQLQLDALSAEIDDERLPTVLHDLEQEGLIHCRSGVYSL